MVGQQGDAAAGEGRTREVTRIPGDRLAQLLRAAGDERLRKRQLEPLGEVGERGLVVQARERRERGGEEIGEPLEALIAGRQVEGLLEAGDEALDLVLADEALDILDELLGLCRRRRGDEPPGQVPDLAARRKLVGVGGVDLVPGLSQVADQGEGERQARAGQQDPHRRHYGSGGRLSAPTAEGAGSPSRASIRVSRGSAPSP